VVLPYPFRGIGALRNSAETQQSDYTFTKNGSRSAKYSVPERLRCGYPEGGELDPAVDDAGSARILLLFYHA